MSEMASVGARRESRSVEPECSRSGVCPAPVRSARVSCPGLTLVIASLTGIACRPGIFPAPQHLNR